MSTLLALETSTTYCSAALLREQHVFARTLDAGQTHSGQILQLVKEVLADAGINLADCDAIGFGAGPGSFTGLRIACAVTQGLAYGASLPVIPVNTLSAMAEQLRTQLPSELAEGSTVLSAMDARMGEIYWSLLVWRNGEWTELSPASLDFPQDVALQLSQLISGQTCDFGCGNAFSVYGEPLSPLVRSRAEVEVPDARGIASLAARALMRGEGKLAQEAAPLYVRDRVALTTQEREQADLNKRMSGVLSSLQTAQV